MRQLKVLMVLALCLLIGCATSGTQAVTLVDRSLVFFNQYVSLEQTYKSHYLASTQSERERLSQTVAPVLDRMRFLVIEYSKAAIAGTDNIDTRLEIVQLGRAAALHLAKEISQ